MADKNKTYIASSVIRIGKREYKPGDFIKKISEEEAAAYLEAEMIYSTDKECEAKDSITEENEALKVRVEELEAGMEEAKKEITEKVERIKELEEKIKEPEAAKETETQDKQKDEDNK